jgi:hypothetical protein
VIDIAEVLEGFVPGTSDPHDFVRLIAAGDDSRLEVDADGAGGNFQPLATLAGVSGTSVDALIASGQLDLGGG